MNICKNCGHKFNESSGICPNCGSRIGKDSKNISPTPTSRIEKKKSQSKNKKLMAVGSIIGVLAVVGVTPFMLKGFHKPVTKTNIAATKKIEPSNNESSQAHQSTDKNSTQPSSDYILPDSDKKVLSLVDIDIIPKWRLRIARNEIYARHGYVFKSKDLEKYFSSKSWYHPNPSFDGSLSEVERKNIATIRAREDSL
ncbi:hypothetical protein BIV60_15210 [Bacillus sp. MUM 116]|uniref:YARHG domain-containing protein n=1 Tax=Bacillus sp. MUM 116 TaxID=1678002 RepID=UPI0008F58440|nr:YARHG domain-containing protein [Bacillus sp. MUM 116]OIK13024.1 hypothetical protein BIV60_15210 [Bacillus sp. MUM 116]